MRRDAELAPQRLGGVMHPEKPPVQRQSIPGFLAALQEISSRAQDLCAIGKKGAVKVCHAKKTLQLFDILKGGGQFRLWWYARPWGPSLLPKSCDHEVPKLEL